MYWSGMCSSAYWDGDLASFFAYSDQFFATHPTQWVPAGAPDPNTDIAIPPEALMHIARGLLDLGAPPDLEVNPTGNSVVNLPTWVWATDGSFMEHRVRAEFNGNWAEVIAEPVGLEIHADGPHELGRRRQVPHHRHHRLAGSLGGQRWPEPAARPARQPGSRHPRGPGGRGADGPGEQRQPSSFTMTS